jgi:site-specific recombinase XerD
MTNSRIGSHIQAFFADYLTSQRDMSPHTIASYRDSVKLLLAFAARHRHTEVSALTFEDLGPDVVLKFLDDIEITRGNSTRTRNARLAAIHTLFGYVAAHEPQLLGLSQRICAIPVKKSAAPCITYLEHEEVLHVLASIDLSRPTGRRDYLLILLLFETGARASELVSLRTSSIRLDEPAQIRILGKGRKERVCPLRKKTAALIRALLRERDVIGLDTPVFVGLREEPLSRFGLLRLVQRHVRTAAKTMPSLVEKRIGPHTFRHAAAIHLLRAGNDLSVVRSWLGHVSIVTTDHYTEIDIEAKRRALDASEPVPSRRRNPSWKKDPDLLAWLEAL